jgi:hypothetical protein
MAHAVRSFWGKGQELCQQVVNIKGFSGSWRVWSTPQTKKKIPKVR